MGYKIWIKTFLSRKENCILQKMFLWKEGFNVAEIIIISNLFILIGYKNVFLFINNEWAVEFNAKLFKIVGETFLSRKPK